MADHYFNNSIKLKLEQIFPNGFDLISDRDLSGKDNMEIDFNRTMEFANGKSNAMFRLYNWSPWCLSLGYNQKDDNIDYDYIKSKGYEVVRRPTGGRAVFHANEITYSIITKIDKINHHEIYRLVHEVLAYCFGIMNINCDYEQSQINNEVRINGGGACFASAAKYELKYNSKKVVGSAQRLFGDVLLQHGSILIGTEHNEICDLLYRDNKALEEKCSKILAEQSISINEILEKKIEYTFIEKTISEVIKANI